MSIDDLDNISLPVQKKYKVEKKRGKISITECELHAPDDCKEFFKEECKKGTEEYDKALKEVEQIEETAEELSKIEEDKDI